MASSIPTPRFSLKQGKKQESCWPPVAGCPLPHLSLWQPQQKAQAVLLMSLPPQCWWQKASGLSPQRQSSRQDLSPLTRDWPHALCSERAGSYPFALQGSPRSSWYAKLIGRVCLPRSLPSSFPGDKSQTWPTLLWFEWLSTLHLKTQTPRLHWVPRPRVTRCTGSGSTADTTFNEYSNFSPIEICVKYYLIYY